MSELPAVLVLMGGESGEHDVSLRSGAAVVRNLPDAGFRPVPVVVGRDGRFTFPPEGPSLDLGEAVSRMRAVAPVAAFIAMHGPQGEDGKIQALFELMHLPYAGSDVYGSAVAMDKALAKAVYRAEGIPTPLAVTLTATEVAREGLDAAAKRVREALGVPVVVKTPRLGSSVGVSIVRKATDLGRHLAEALARDDRVLCEAFKKGRELTVPVLEDPDTGEPRALPVIEIRVKRAAFFDYETKYDPDATDEICPAPIPDDLAREVQAVAVKAHRALLLSGFSRTDFIVADDGAWVLETNTIPGLTEASLFPKACGVSGISFPKLLQGLVNRAILRTEAERKRTR
jgi:D-alanine-D-alanine ligase